MMKYKIKGTGKLETNLRFFFASLLEKRNPCLSHSQLPVLQSDVKLEETEPGPRQVTPLQGFPREGSCTGAGAPLAGLAGHWWSVFCSKWGKDLETAPGQTCIWCLLATKAKCQDCTQNYLHYCFYERKTTSLFCYAKYILGLELSKLVIISLTLFSLGEWQDLYPCLRMELSQQSEFLKKSSPEKINAQYYEICPHSSLPCTHVYSLLSIGRGYKSMNAINSQTTQSCIYISLPVPFPCTYKRSSRCSKKRVLDQGWFSFTSTQVPWLCSFQICIQLSNKSPSKSPNPHS